MRTIHRKIIADDQYSLIISDLTGKKWIQVNDIIGNKNGHVKTGKLIVK